MTGFDAVHDHLRAVARDLLDAADPDRGPAWGLLAESGWLGLEVPEAQGGAGATFAEVAVVLEEMGRAATPSAYLGSVVLGVGALALVEPNERRDALLAAVAAGDAPLAVGLPADDDGAPFRLAGPAGGARLHGQAAYVLDAGDAAHLLLPAVDDDGAAVLAVLAPGAPGVTVRPRPVLDATRNLASVVVEGAALDAAATWRLAGDGSAALRRLRDRAAVAVAVDSLGVSEGMLAATVAYAAARHQFGRPIGSFQAVKHACADLAVDAAVTRELVRAAVAEVAAGQPDGGTAAAMAASYATEAAVRAAGTAMQLHGGIGYTWESGIHVHLKRAALNRSLFGSPAAHRRRLAERYAEPASSGAAPPTRPR